MLPRVTACRSHLSAHVFFLLERISTIHLCVTNPTMTQSNEMYPLFIGKTSPLKGEGGYFRIWRL